jgi:hypothetical protein
LLKGHPDPVSEHHHADRSAVDRGDPAILARGNIERSDGFVTLVGGVDQEQVAGSGQRCVVQHLGRVGRRVERQRERGQYCSGGRVHLVQLTVAATEQPAAGRREGPCGGQLPFAVEATHSELARHRVERLGDQAALHPQRVVHDTDDPRPIHGNSLFDRTVGDVEMDELTS